MFEIIPNWHPIFVHFTVALLSLSVGFHVLITLITNGIIKQQFAVMARWNLWLGTAFGIITAIAGWFAYNSVVHDAPSHVAMTCHRNWALVTLAVFILLTAWSLWCERTQRPAGRLFLAGLLVGGVLLTSTAWRGAEAVYRYGLGVMSLPQGEAVNHGHGSHDHFTKQGSNQTAGQSATHDGHDH